MALLAEYVEVYEHMAIFTKTNDRDGVYYVEGELTFLSINKKMMKKFHFIKTDHDICIDLAHVTRLDSAGLALIIEWIKIKGMFKGSLMFSNVPKQLIILASLGGFSLNDYLYTP